ncbi:hypothetical protein JHN59_13950 [Streptomyces sp. MBT49]|uniref:hypothetical protein n=1 Tax=Streptomyces sp. MBT49 TaxID=1488380 RepID=UPI00190A9ED0|nr:hypothetical protein [Streptomyces sp. MBT49]MBK3625927.1 hypothetical protein [Streptomyces sp. MBT49]
MRERITTALDTTGLLLVAAGGGAAAYRWLAMGWAALAVSGALVLAGSWLAARAGSTKGGST